MREEEGRRGRNIGAGDFFRSRRGGERCEGGVNREEHGPDTLEPAAEGQNIFLVLDRPGLTASTTDGPDITACKKSSRRKSGNGAWRAPTSRLTRPHSLSLLSSRRMDKLVADSFPEFLLTQLLQGGPFGRGSFIPKWSHFHYTCSFARSRVRVTRL